MNILLIDDNPEDSAYIKEIITRDSHNGYSLIHTKTINQGIEILKSEKIGIILLALFIADIDDLNGLKKILISFPGIPVFVFTTLGNEDIGTKAVSLGAMDYFVKGEINDNGLMQSIENSAARYPLQINTEYPGDYLTDNLGYLKKIIHYGQKAEVFLDYNVVFKELKGKISDLSIPYIFSLFLVNKKKNQLVLVAHNRPGWKDIDKPISVSDKETIMFEAVLRKKIISKDEFVQSRMETDADKNKKIIQETAQVLCIPLETNLDVLGVLNLYNAIPTGFTPAFLIRLKILIHSIATAIKNDLLNKRLEELLFSDDLTGIYNQRYLIWELDREIKRVKRYHGSLSILVIDIENFKGINDEYGYKNGDYILKKIAILLKKHIRITDLIGRYDSDKFVAVLTETSGSGALSYKERIRESIVQYKIDIEDKPPVRVQLNINSAEYDVKLKDAKEFIDYVMNPGDKKPEGNKTETGVVPAPGSKEEKLVTSLHFVRIFFIEPLELISVVIDTLVKMGFESYQVDEKDKLKLLRILEKDARNVIFICISSQNEIDTWFDYIMKIEQMRDYMIQVGAFVYSRMDQQYGRRFLEKNIALIKFSDLQQNTLAVLKKILFYFEARGRRNYVRVDAVDDSQVFFTIEGERKVIKAKVLNISEQIFTCHFSKTDIHLLIPGRYFLKVLLRLKGIVIHISAKVLASKKDNPLIWIIQIYSALYKNNKVSFTTALNKETKDKLHRYIRFCLKENIKQKLNQVQ
ncbi:MAG: response regulator [Spirochaetales bacterium]|nr:response regulator [Spirochaetales bacterium]